MKRTVLAAAAAFLSVATLLAPASVAPATAAPAKASPTGANNWSCRPTAAHRTPVIIVHGTFVDDLAIYNRLSSVLVAQGYCVFALKYGSNGTAAVADSAAELKVFVNKVLAATRAAKVSFVGHSQGGTMPRYYIKYLGGASKVDDLIGFAPGNHGTDQPVLRLLRTTCRACADMITGSWFLSVLNFGDESPGAVSYTNLVTRLDNVVTPYTSGFLKAAPNVRNIRIQDYCPANRSDHVTVVADPAFIRFALNALAHAGPARASFRPRCTW